MQLLTLFVYIRQIFSIKSWRNIDKQWIRHSVAIDFHLHCYFWFSLFVLLFGCGCFSSSSTFHFHFGLFLLPLLLLLLLCIFCFYLNKYRNAVSVGEKYPNAISTLQLSIFEMNLNIILFIVRRYLNIFGFHQIFKLIAKVNAY